MVTWPNKRMRRQSTLSRQRLADGWGRERGVLEKWTPMSMGSNLLAWWDATQGLTLVGSQVSKWVDRKGGMEVSQAVSAARPLYSAAGYNGKPALLFDGVDDLLRVENTTGLPTGANRAEVWAVVQQNANDNGVHLVLSYGGLNGASARYTGVSDEKPFVLASGTQVSATSVPDLLSRHLIRSRYTPTAIFVGADGSAEATANVVPNTDTLRTTVGAAWTSAFYWNGLIKHLIVATPSAPEAALLHNYLMNIRNQ